MLGAVIRRLWLAPAAAGVVLVLVVHGAAGGMGCSARVAGAGVGGQFAFLRGGTLELLRLPDCRLHALVTHGAQAPVAFSPDGRYLAYGAGTLIATRGGAAPQRPLGWVGFWAWSPRGDQLAAVTRSGAVELWTPGAGTRLLLGASWGAGGLAFSPDGRRLVVSKTARKAGVDSGELWRIDLGTRASVRLARVSNALPFVAGVTPDGADALFSADPQGSGSIAADGLALEAVPLTGGVLRTLVPSILNYPGFIAPCGLSMIVTAGAGRESNLGKSLAVLRPPAYRSTTLGLSPGQSWVTPSCSARGAIAAAAGRSSDNAGFGLQHRSIWLIPTPGAPAVRLTNPGPLRMSDELPRMAGDGRYILFVRAVSGGGAVQHGQLELIALGRHGHSRLIGPIAQLGSAGIGYYDHYPWSSVTAWSPR